MSLFEQQYRVGQKWTIFDNFATVCDRKKGATYPYRGVGGVLISLPLAVSP